MADTFTQSFNQALNLGLQMESQKRLEQVAAVDMQMKQMQMQKMAQNMAVDQMIQSELKKPGDFRPTMTNVTQEQGNALENLGYSNPELFGRQPTQFQQAFSSGFSNPSAALELGRMGLPVEEIKKVVPQVQPKADMTLENLLAAEVKAGRMTLKDAIVAKSGAKEFNIPSGVDEFLMTKFSDYSANPASRQKASQWLATPEGRSEYLKWKRDVGETRPVNISFIPTDQGIVGLNPRNPQASPISTGFGKPTPSEQMSRLSDLETLKYNVETALKNYDKSYVGPVAGRVGSVKEQVVDLPEKQVQFYAAVRDAQDSLLRARSGAQINEQEYKRLVAFLPDINLPSGNFEARMSRFYSELNTTISNRKRQLSQGGYGGSQVPQATHKFIPGKGIVPIGQ